MHSGARGDTPDAAVYIAATMSQRQTLRYLVN
jgi:hypothetical protein